MPSISPEQLIQRMSDAGIMDARQVESLWAELGTREVTTEALKGLLLRKELVTNYQLDRLRERRTRRLLLRRLQGAVSGRHRHLCPRLSGRPQAKRTHRLREGASQAVPRRQGDVRAIPPRRQDRRATAASLHRADL